MAEGKPGAGQEAMSPVPADIVTTHRQPLKEIARRKIFDPLRRVFSAMSSSSTEATARTDTNPSNPAQETQQITIREPQSFTPDELKDPIKRRQFLARLAIFSGVTALATAKTPDLALGIPEFHWPPTFKEGEPIQVKGNQIRLIGVDHSVQNIEVYKEKIREQIRNSNSPFVFLEYFDENVQPKALLTTTEADLKDNGTFGDSTNKFYSAIGKMCAEEGKDIIVVNPENTNTRYVVSFLTAGLFAGASIDKMLDRFKEKFGQPITRRNLLKGVAKTTAGLEIAALFGGVQGVQQILTKTGILTPDLPEKERAHILAWSIFDWRDINSAKGMEKAMEVYKDEVQPNSVTPAFNGDWHQGMAEYLKKPGLREIKNKFYGHFNAFGENSVRRFTYDKQQNKWNLKEKVSY